MRRWTPQQEAVFEAVACSTGHVSCNSVAGSGKSTTIEESTRRGKGKIGLVTFNRYIAEELQGRLNGSATACTLHHLGFMACKSAWNSELDEGKLKRLLRSLYPMWFKEKPSGAVWAEDEARATMNLARLCKYSMLEGTAEQLDVLVEHHGVEVPYQAEADVYPAVAELLAACAGETHLVDFDDMIWLPNRHSLNVGAFDLLFVDETQDLSRCQQLLAFRASERLVIVGDTRQAIYGFTGADCDAMPRLQKELSILPAGCLERPLTVTFRCPETHVELAQKIVPQIVAASDAVPGLVEHVSPDRVWLEVMPGDLVICRCNAPLIDAAYRLIRHSIPVLVRGRDVGKGLLDLITQLKATNCSDLSRRLKSWHDREWERLERRDAPESSFQSLTDKFECLDNLTSRFANLEELRQFIADLFSDESDRSKVVLSSIHRAKGLEARRVVIIAPEKLPLIRKDARPWQITQELNLIYIAVSRAKQELYFAGDIPSILRS